jgi:hypothetical protein
VGGEKRIAGIALWLFGIVTVAAFAWVLVLGYMDAGNPLLLSGRIFDGVPLLLAFCALTFALQTGVIVSVSTGIYRPSVFVWSAVYAAAIQPLSMVAWVSNDLLASVIPVLAVGAIGIKRKCFLPTVKRLGVLSVSVMAYQAVSLWLKAGIPVSVNNIGVFEKVGHVAGASIHFDMLLFLSIIFMKEGWKHAGWRNFKLVFLQRGETGQRGHHAIDPPADAEALAYENATGIEWLISRSLKVGAQALQMGAIALGCALAGLLPNGIIVAVSFAAFGMVFVNRWHPSAATPLAGYFKCMGSSVVIFVAAANMLPAFRFSWFLLVLMGFAVCYAAFLVRALQEMAWERDAILAKLQEKPPLDLPPEEWERLLAVFEFTHEEKAIITLRRRHGSDWTNQRYAVELNISPRTYDRRVAGIKRKVNKG